MPTAFSSTRFHEITATCSLRPLQAELANFAHRFANVALAQLAAPRNFLKTDSSYPKSIKHILANIHPEHRQQYTRNVTMTL